MIWIVTDSAQELKTDRRNGLVVTDLALIANGEPLPADITHEQFFEKLNEKGTTMTTSQVSPAVYMDLFEDLLKNPEDEVVVITIASKLSGTYNSARLAMNGENADRIHLVDSQTVSFPMTLLVQEALELREQGKSAKEIVNILEEDKKKVRILGIIPTLEYLKKGGRISAATAAIGEIAGVKPILSVLDGEVVIPLKVRGMKKAYNSTARLAKEWNIDLDRPVLFGYTGTKKDAAEVLEHAFEEQLEKKFDGRYEAGCLILGTHVGPDGAAVGFFVK